ncbi:MAG: prolipoprotein diacylglyceryl transferase [Bdellovibrionota bacterium]
MDPQVKNNYWTFDLSPFIFQVKNIPFQWLTTVLGILFVVVFFVGGYIASQKLLKTPQKREFFQSMFIYLFIILGILFGLNKMHVNWGLRWYSTMYLGGFLTFYLASLFWIKKKSFMLTENLLVSLVAFIIIGMLVGARLAYVFIYNWGYYSVHPLEAVATWQGGLSFHGGVVGIAIAVILFCRKYKIPFFHLTDKIVLITPIGIGLGRIGNFMNGELWGRPIQSHVPWAIIFPDGGSIARHPSQIYQSLGEGWGLFLTLFIISRFKQKEGTLSGCFIIFYCIYRFVVEYFRAADVQVSYFYLNHFDWAPLKAYPDTQWWQILTMGQILCFLFVFAGILMVIFTRKNILAYSPEWLKRNEEFFKTHTPKISN